MLERLPELEKIREQATKQQENFCYQQTKHQNKHRLLGISQEQRHKHEAGAF